jgi:hypothetical protein
MVPRRLTLALWRLTTAPWRLTMAAFLYIDFSSPIRYYKKLDRFKRCYHGFAPSLEINQTVSSNSYYVMLNGFMFFKTWGLRKNFNPCLILPDIPFKLGCKQ